MPEESTGAAKQHDFQADIDRVSRIPAVPTILDVVRRTTGMRFVAVARVTADRWVACSVLDELGFGLVPGGELKIETTICDQIQQTREPVIIDNVAADGAWCSHPTPTMYGFSSYISMPVILSDGSFFGTLCAIDSKPARLNTAETIGMFRLFAELIAKNLDVTKQLAITESALVEERTTAELREQFIAVLGHDLRNPMRGISCLVDLLAEKVSLDPEAANMARLMRDSASRMSALIENLMDFARGRLGGGLTLVRNEKTHLEPVLQAVMAELSVTHPDRVLETQFSLADPVSCDEARISQLFSNLLGNALTYGQADRPVRVRAISTAGNLELSVANDGEPIPAAVRERLFHPFYRDSTSRHLEGLGLGLFIAHEIATAHGGTLEVQSTEQETCFTFRMPA